MNTDCMAAAPDDEPDPGHVTEEAAECEAVLMDWYKALTEAVDGRLPEMAARHEHLSGEPQGDDLSPCVRESQDLMVVSALRAMARISERILPAPASPFRIDTSRFGRDC